MGFEVEGENVATFGGNSYATVWFAPNSNAWIMLEKALFNQCMQTTRSCLTPFS
jgi:hypothetical protein